MRYHAERGNDGGSRGAASLVFSTNEFQEEQKLTFSG